MIRTKDIIWLAGLLEGEGSFVSRHENDQPRIMLDMTDRDVILRAADIFGVSKVSQRSQYLTRKGNLTKPTFIIRLDTIRAASWMMTLYSLMGERRQKQIEFALERWRNRIPKPRRLKSLCKNGHALSGTNRTKYHGCRICRDAYLKAWRQNKKIRSEVL